MVFIETVLLIIITTRVASLSPLAVPIPTPALSEDHQMAPEELLKSFGLSEPGVRRWYSEPPQYMLDLYNEIADSNGLTRLPGPYGATIVRAFSEKDGSRDSVFSFSVTGLGADEQVLEVEFHVHYSRLTKAERHLLQDNIYMIEIHWVKERGHQLLVKEKVAAHSSGWRVFKVGRGIVGTSALSEYDQRRVTLEVTATTLTGDSLPLRLHHGVHGPRQPLLVFFSLHSSGNNTITAPVSIPEVKKEFESPLANRVRRSLHESFPRIPQGCVRRDMNVDFGTIGWSSWIVYPKSYNAYQCTGQCMFPLGQNLNPTNHATVQSIIHLSGEFPDVQRPCCVPSSYANLSILFYDAEENVVLKQYEQMVALQCGCH
ncbi:bone morphogenetic protein 5-like [Cherax quadricarinatus]|nr:bone morphogenetic protein 5-like [Cherax quadricarinatus]